MEGKVFEFGLYSIQSETIGQRGIEIKRLACYLAAFLFFLTFYVSHIVEAVAYLDEDDTDVFTHREEELLEIFGLCFGLCTKDAAGNLCQSVNNLCYLCAEDILNIINGIVGILNRVMEQSSANAGRAKSHLLGCYDGNREGMYHIWLAAGTCSTLVGVAGKVVCLLYQVHLLTVG